MSPLALPGTEFVLRSPWMLVLLAAIPLVFLLPALRPAPALLFSGFAFLPPAGRADPRSRVRRALPPAVLSVGLVALVVALSRPAERVVVPATEKGIDILLVLDVSSSMEARDLGDPRTRLEVAREAAVRFTEGRAGDRIGLLTFARYPDLRCPPTLDHRALREMFADVRSVPSDGPEDATAIGGAVARATQALRSAPGRSRVVVLLTDGEENVAVAGAPKEIGPVPAGQLAAAAGIRVHAVVVGPGSEGPRAAGRPRIDTRPVERMTATTEGTFHTATDATALRRVYERIDVLERTAAAAPRIVLADRFLPAFAVGAALVLVARLLRGARSEPIP